MVNVEGRPRVSIDKSRPTIIGADNADAAGGDDGDGDNTPSSPPEPLYHSSRLKGYIALLVSALYNFLAADERQDAIEKTQRTEAADAITPTQNRTAEATQQRAKSDYCLIVDHNLGNLAPTRQSATLDSLNLTMACSMITVIMTSFIVLCHFDFCTPLRKNVWPKAFGPHGKVELVLLLFFVLFWIFATWFNTTIKGPGGEGKEQYNLYFSSWICTWASLWTLERWCTCSGRASFIRFVRSWPNRCPLWIVTFIMSLADFLFVLDTHRNWEEGTKYSPYVYNLYSNVNRGEWTLLYFVTCTTWSLSLAWALAEIFRENVTNVANIKSDVEFYAEGITVHFIAILWIITVCIVTMPGGAASLIGNLYFTTWSTLFSVIGTLIWFVRDWRQMIVDVFQEQQDIYDEVKRTYRIREEERLTKLAAKERGQEEGHAGNVHQSGVNSSNNNDEESKVEEDEEVVLCEDDPDVDDDMTISIASGWRGPSSVTSSPGSRKVASSDKTTPAEVRVTASSLFMSAVSFFYTRDDQPVADDDDEAGTGSNQPVVDGDGKVGE